MPIPGQFENTSAPRLFINYRSTDTGQTASRLYTELERELETGQVFLDHEQIEAGVDWPERLLREVERATIMFVLIGGRWLTEHDPETGDRRLNIPRDWVRQEIEAALGRTILVVPVLVDDTPPLNERALQTVPSIAPLAKLQTRPLRRKDWKGDFQRLVQLLICYRFKARDAGNAGEDDGDGPLLHLVIDRLDKFRETRFGRNIVYGTVELVDCIKAYGEGITLQLTLVNRASFDVVVPTIDIFVQDYDSHPLEVYNYSELQTPGTHLEVPGTTLPDPVELTEHNYPGTCIPVTKGRLFLHAGSSGVGSQHTISFSVVARDPGIWKFRVRATSVDAPGLKDPFSVESGILCVVKR